MASRISFQFDFQGLDNIIKQLKEIESLLNNIQRLGGLAGAVSAINGITNRGGTNVKVYGGSAGSNIAGQAIGSRLATPHTNWSRDHEYQWEMVISALLSMAPVSSSPNIAAPGKMSNMTQFLSNFSGNMSANSMLGKYQAAMRMSGGSMIGGLGAVLGEMGPLKLGIIAVTSAFVLLYKSAQQLEEGIRHGAEAYQHAAKLGQGVGSTYQQASAFRAIGMEPPDISQLSYEKNKKNGGYNAPDTDTILAAARAGQLGEVQQLLNMSKEFRAAMRDGANAAVEMEGAARQNLILAMSQSALGREWHTMLSQISALLSPLIELLSRVGVEFLKIVNAILFIINIIEKEVLKLLGIDLSNDKNTKIPIKSASSHAGTWERLGFNFPKAGIDHNAQTAANTRQTAANTYALVKLLDAYLKTISTGVVSLPNLAK